VKGGGGGRVEKGGGRVDSGGGREDLGAGRVEIKAGVDMGGGSQPIPMPVKLPVLWPFWRSRLAVAGPLVACTPPIAHQVEFAAAPHSGDL